MQYLPEYTTAVITVSAAFMALAGIIMGVVGTRQNGQGSIWNRIAVKRITWYQIIIATNAISVIWGIITMVYGLNWFLYPNQPFNNLQITLMFQFVFVFAPLTWFLALTIFRRNNR